VPELPEVETIKNDLLELVVGAKVEGVEIREPALLETPRAGEFARRVVGRTIGGAWRRGKNLVVGFEGGYSLVLQLKIGGQVLLVPPVEEPASALMLVLSLDGDRRLFVRDETGFTRGALLTGPELEERFARLGPEPFSEEFDAGYLPRTLGTRRAQIKPLLLQQKVVAGIGNIYVDESLFDAGIHPRRKANSLSEREWGALYEAVRSNLTAGIRDRGTTFSLYRDVLGRRGGHQEHLKVFLRAGKDCPRGDGKVVKETVGGRATFVCPACQLEDGPDGEQRLTLGIF
jgi:formamidopyrimidine-DNA glycosylase